MSLLSISPIDGRYENKTKELQEYFSEFGLIKYRVEVELKYFISLVRHPLPELRKFPHQKLEAIEHIFRNFSLTDAEKVKEYERITNHDVKAAEYFLKEKFNELGLSEFSEFIHFGLTSQDINNTAVPLFLKEMLEKIYLPFIENVVEELRQIAEKWKDITIIAKTHGQPASPTSLGKEIFVFCYRLNKQLKQLKELQLECKFGGATGNFNAHYASYPEINWIDFANRFCKSLGLERQQFTTQIENYDGLAALFDNLRRINVILLDLCRDMWLYISMDYFKQKIVKGEVGSSTMPHKVNPIDFENAEGNIGVANSLFDHLSNKLPVSRLQRDLSDSTVIRNSGVPFAHSFIALKSLKKGLSKLMLNKNKIDSDIEDNWAVIAEAIQTILRRAGFKNPYELLKELTRGNEKITQKTIQGFIDNLDVSQEIKDRLKSLSPETYTGENPPFKL